VTESGNAASALGVWHLSLGTKTPGLALVTVPVDFHRPGVVFRHRPEAADTEVEWRGVGVGAEERSVLDLLVWVGNGRVASRVGFDDGVGREMVLGFVRPLVS